jgi:hypothetical protein
LLELQLPHSSKRLDCLITGKDSQRQPSAVIVELKQWETSRPSGGENEVVSYVGGRWRDLLHPSAQVLQYKMYLEDNHTAFDDPNAIRLHACSYLHNHQRHSDDPVFDEKFSSLLKSCPVFTKDTVERLARFLKEPLLNGDNGTVRERIENGKYRASKKLLDHVAAVIAGKPEYVLLDEQLVVFDQVMSSAEKALEQGRPDVDFRFGYFSAAYRLGLWPPTCRATIAWGIPWRRTGAVCPARQHNDLPRMGR